ncbi:unnamed protein product [Camellia sinensis]
MCKEDGRKAWKSPTGPSEKDKEFFEDKLSSSAAALDNLHNQMKTSSLRFESSEEIVGNYAMIKLLEATVSVTRLDMERLNSKMEEDIPHEDGGQGEDEGHEEELGRDEDDDDEGDKEELGTEDVKGGDEFSKEP